MVHGVDDVITLMPARVGLGSDSVCPPGFPTQLHVITSLSTGGGRVSRGNLSEGVSGCAPPRRVVAVIHSVTVLIRYG